MRCKIIFPLLLVLCAAPAFANGPWRASEANTRGWQLMTPAERIEHQARVRSFRRYEDCQAYRDSHHQLLEERARAQGKQLPPDRRDICGHLKPPSPAASGER